MNTKVLIVDDSRIFRGAIEESLSRENDIQVIGSVRNGVKAIEFIKRIRPDLITLDVEMPDMDGLETLEAIQRFNVRNRDLPGIGVIMISSFTQKGADITIQALEAGAFDFITKPEGKTPNESIEILRRQLVVKIRFFASRRIHLLGGKENIANDPKRSSDKPEQKSGLISVPGRFPDKKRVYVPGAAHGQKILTRHRVQKEPVIHRARAGRRASGPANVEAVLIGVSTGGPKALAEMLPGLCALIQVPIFIVQHMPPTFTESLAKSLDTRCSYTVTEARNNDRVQNHHAYIAPGGKHLLVRRPVSGSDEIRIVINKRPPEKGCRPSADILFRSAAAAYQGNVIAIILTGMGNDGTKGAGTVKRSGGYVIVQDQETSVVWGMPGSAQNSGCADEVVPLGDIPNAVKAVIGN